MVGAAGRGSARPAAPPARRGSAGGGIPLAANPRPHATFRKQIQNMSPTASGLLNSESTKNAADSLVQI